MQRFPKALQSEIYSFLPHAVSQYLQTNDLGWVVDSPHEFELDFLVRLYESYLLNPEIVIRRACETNNLPLLKRLLKEHPQMDINACVTGHHHEIVTYLFSSNRIKNFRLAQQCLLQDNIISLNMFHFPEIPLYMRVSKKVFWWAFERGYFMQCTTYDETMLEALWNATLNTYGVNCNLNRTEPCSFFWSYVSEPTFQWAWNKWKHMEPGPQKNQSLTSLVALGCNIECIELYRHHGTEKMNACIASNIDVLRYFDLYETDWQYVVEHLRRPQTREMLEFYETKLIHFTSDVLRQVAKCTDFETFKWFHKRHVDIPLKEICMIGSRRSDIKLVHYAWANGCCQDTIVHGNTLKGLNWKCANAENVMQIINTMSYPELKLKFQFSKHSLYPHTNIGPIDSDLILHKLIMTNLTQRDNVIWYRTLKPFIKNEAFYSNLVHEALHEHAWLIVRDMLMDGMLNTVFAKNKPLKRSFYHHIVDAPKYLTRHFDLSDVSRYYCSNDLDDIDCSLLKLRLQ